MKSKIFRNLVRLCCLQQGPGFVPGVLGVGGVEQQQRELHAGVGQQVLVSPQLAAARPRPGQHHHHQQPSH